MDKKKIVVLLGHPDNEPTLSRAFADEYENAAREAGHEVRRFNLGEMQFDPILRKGYKVIQDLEPDLKTLQEAMRWCDHFMLVYPTWWVTMPALLKGLFDRMWLPAFAFRMRKHADGTPALGWHKLLKGKTARVVVLSDSRPILIRLFFGDYTNEISRGILWFAGMSVALTRVGPIKGSSDAWREKWKKRMAAMGKHGA
jgi:putative NADPH-quinone reductase